MWTGLWATWGNTGASLCTEVSAPVEFGLAGAAIRLPIRDVAVHGLWTPDCRGVISFMIVADLFSMSEKFATINESV